MSTTLQISVLFSLVRLNIRGQYCIQYIERPIRLNFSRAPDKIRGILIIYISRLTYSCPFELFYSPEVCLELARTDHNDIGYYSLQRISRMLCGRYNVKGSGPKAGFYTNIVERTSRGSRPIQFEDVLRLRAVYNFRC